MSDTLSPAALAAVSSAATGSTPRAVRHFGLAAMEARAARTGRAVTGPTPSRPVAPVQSQRPARRVVVRLWLPTTLLFLLLAPFALLLAPLGYFAPPPYNRRPLAAVLGVGALLLSLGGTVVDVDAREALIRIRLF
jgi:hypothetical protein